MNDTIRKMISFACIITLFLLVMGGGCGDKKQQQQDRQQTVKVKDDTLCKQCAAYDCEGCQAAPVCVKQCGCSQCGGEEAPSGTTEEESPGSNSGEQAT